MALAMPAKESVCMDYINKEDIARKLFRKRQTWRNEPTVSVRGAEGEFGVLRFTFNENDAVELRVYLKDRNAILEAAEAAVMEFSDIINKLWRNHQ
jgi:limonene-1,2-epoxide hydrolase